MWDKARLAGLSIGPSDLLKIATHSKMKLYPTLPPAPVPLRDEGEATADEAASDPPSPKEVGPGNVDKDKEKEDSGGDVIEGMDELLENEAAEEQARKRQMAESVEGSNTKMAKTNPTAEKHGASEMVDKEKVKVPRLDLSGSPSASSAGGGFQASPMNAGNIRRVSTYGGVDVYVEEEDESCIDLYMDELLAGIGSFGEACFADEKRGPPEVEEDVLRALDKEAAVEGIDRLMNMKVIEEYGCITGKELVLDTRQGDIVMGIGTEGVVS